MKTPSTLVAALLAAASIASVGAFATETDKTPTAEAPAAKAKPPSQTQEKTGVAPAAKESKGATDEKAAAEKKKVSKARHFHPRDGK